MELSLEDRERIYQEEKARRETSEEPTAKPKAKMPAGRKPRLAPAILIGASIVVFLLILQVVFIGAKLTPGQHLEKAQLALQSGASLYEISEALVHLAAIPASAPEAEKARTLGLESKLRKAQSAAAIREARQAPVAPTSSPASTSSAFGALEVQARQYMRGLGFTAKSTDEAMKAAKAASQADPDLGTPFDVLQRMGSIASIGLAGQQELRSIGTDYPAMGKVMGFTSKYGPSGVAAEVYTAFRGMNAEDRILALSLAMEER